ncbi:PH domain-containing protein [Corynebacterium sp.]|uniref:PH domain-containing protein n=1 Tax=Corynebacterium sp. TaxID=1720 RepID=UPI0025C6358A|nr:PH domain-containing protein [Corynebacterium sp.]
MSSVESPALPHQVRTDQAHLIAGVLMLAMSFVGVAYAPKILFWLPLLPVVFIVGVLRTRTEFTERGITARYLLRPTKSLAWDDFKALRFTRGGKALAVSTTEKTFPLPGVSFNSLVTLAEVTGGRIPDPVTPSLSAIDEKVRVVERDSGLAVLMDEDEYGEYEAARRASHMAREELERRRAANADRDDTPAPSDDS